ncbi:MAG: site-specific integrase [Patescibacteria group bacterium]|nr:site-specific integrase [Patescibacteria group bacterium]
MSTFRRPGSKNWWYKFQFRGRRIQASARTTNRSAAKDIEAAHRVRLARGDAGISERQRAPTLRRFSDEFLLECRTRYGDRKTDRFYAQQVRYLLAAPYLASAALDKITPSLIARFTSERRQSVSLATVNRQLATLRRILRLAAERGILTGVPRVRLLPGEAPRDYVLPRGRIEDDYIEGLPEVGGRVARLILEAGLRGREALTLRWRDVATPARGNRGHILIRREVSKSGKPRTVPLTAAGWRAIDANPRVGELVFGDPPPSLVVLEKWHRRVRAKLKLPSEFVLHSLRHTALTRLGEAGVDAFSIREIAGHASVVTSQRYVHPVPEAIDRAMGKAERLATVLATAARRSESNGPRARRVSPKKTAS